MSLSRRRFVAGLSALPLLATLPAAHAAGPGVSARIVEAGLLHRFNQGRAARRLKLLVLGGTTFVGPAIVRYALDRGHDVTLFNRGLTNPGLFPEVRTLHGDRTSPEGLAALREGEWDAVIDTWQWEPSAVADSLRLLEGRYGRYLFVSSIAVYGGQNYRQAEVTEESPLPEYADDHAMRQRDAEGALSYSVRKLDADNAVRQLAGDRAIVLRPHAISGRFAVPESENQLYWPMRVQEGGDILAPGDGQDFLQYIDVADLGRFAVQACEEELRGVYNTCRRVSFMEYLYGLRALVSTPQVRIHWGSWEFLEPHGIRPFAQLPQWVPRQRSPGFNNHRDDRAVAAGLTYRPFAETMRDLLDCANAFLPAGHRWGVDGDRVLLTRDRERELLGLLGAA